MIKLLSPSQVAEILGVPLRTLYAWRQTNYGPVSFKVGRHLRYEESEVLKFIDVQRSTTNPEAA